jgi:hypothetical protein
MEISVTLHMKKRYVNILRRIVVIKGSIVHTSMFIKVVRIMIWDFVIGEENVSLNIFQGNCVGIICMDFVKREENVQIIILRFLMKEILFLPRKCVNVT